MTEPRFKVGDRVTTKETPSDPLEVDVGTIVEFTFARCRVHWDEAGEIYTEEPDDLVHVNAVTCTHPEHRRGTHGRLRSNQEVCMTCGAIVLKKRRS